MPQPCTVSTASVNLTANGAPAQLQADVRISSAPNLLSVATDGLLVPPAIPLAAALPAGPADGAAFRYKALTASTGALLNVDWQFVYDQGDATWYFIGGGSLIGQVLAAESTVSLSYVALSTPGPSIIVPFYGDYLVELGAQMDTPAATTAHMSYDCSVAANDQWSARVQATGAAATARACLARATVATGVPAGVAITAKYRESSAASGASVFDMRWLKVTPIRLNP